jgi:hypothetical protein
VPRFILYSSPPTGDQAFYLMITSSLAEDRDINVANNYAQRDYDKFYGLAPRPEGFVGIDAPYPLYPALAQSTARPPEEQYASHHVPGFPLLLLPSWIVGSWFELWWPATVVFMCLIGALVAVNIFLLAYEATGRLWIALAVWLPMAFSNPVFSYSFMLFTELTAGLLLIYAFRRMSLGWGSNNRIRLFLVGLCIAYIPWLAWRTVLIAIPLLIYALVQWWRHAQNKADGRQATANGDPREAGDSDEPKNPPTRWKERLGLRRIGWGNVLSLGWVLVPVAVSGVLLVSLHLFLFGTFLPPNRVPERGDVSPFHWPWQGLEELTRFFTTTFALLLDRRMGLITFAPIFSRAPPLA